MDVRIQVEVLIQSFSIFMSVRIYSLFSIPIRRFGNSIPFMNRQLLAVIWLSLSLLISSCSAPTQLSGDFDRSGSEEISLPPDTFKVLTYNTWHGLNVGSFWVTPNETPETHKARFDLQIKELTEVQPDLVFLQEVNPLPQKAEDYVNALQKYELDYLQVHQVDACGIRVSQGKALISELNNGLAILAKKELQLRPIEGIKLNGGVGTCKSTWGFQFEELRYAVVAQITLPGTNKKYLVASVHQHSGLEGGPDFIQELSEFHNQGKLEDYIQVKWEFERPHLQRLDGIATLMRGLKKLDRQDEYAGFILGGDFNFEPDDQEYEDATVRLGLTDTSSLAENRPELFTYDPLGNPINVEHMSPNIPDSLEKALEKETLENREAILTAYKVEMARPRKIDHIFSDSFLSTYCLQQKLFGLQLGADGRPGSDHYGLLNIYSRVPR